ncbi:MAG: hypothetical protein Q9205_007953 [Flavoplaca limonia]
MKIQKIISKFHTLSPEPSNPSIITGNRCHKITLSIQGPVYTSSHTTSSSHIRITDTHRSKAVQTYDTEWFHLFQPDDIHSTSFSSIHSRLYEADAISAYLPSFPASKYQNPTIPYPAPGPSPPQRTNVSPTPTPLTLLAKANPSSGQTPAPKL